MNRSDQLRVRTVPDGHLTTIEVVRSMAVDDPRSMIGAYSTAPYASLSEAQLLTLARQLVQGEVFCDRQVRDPSMLPMIFMPLMFSSPLEQVRFVKQHGAVYARMEHAFPRSMNGYPCFFQIGILNRADGARFYEIATHLHGAVQAALHGQQEVSDGNGEGDADDTAQTTPDRVD